MPISRNALEALDSVDALVRAYALPDPACAELDALDDGEACRQLIPDDLAAPDLAGGQLPAEGLGAELLRDEPACPDISAATRRLFVQRLLDGEPAVKVLAAAGAEGLDPLEVANAALDAMAANRRFWRRRTAPLRLARPEVVR